MAYEAEEAREEAGLVVGGAYAQAPADLSGFWNLQAQAFLGVGAAKGEALPDCEFEGSADMTQDGTDLSGSAELSLTAGGAECPAMLGGTLSGQVTDDQLDMGMMIMGMEQGNFSGSAVKAAKGAPAVTALAGTFSITAGPLRRDDRELERGPGRGAGRGDPDSRRRGAGAGHVLADCGRRLRPRTAAVVVAVKARRGRAEPGGEAIGTTARRSAGGWIRPATCKRHFVARRATGPTASASCDGGKRARRGAGPAGGEAIEPTTRRACRA